MVDTKVSISLRHRLVKIHETRRLGKTPGYLKERVAKLANVPVENVRLSDEVNRLVMLHLSRKMRRAEFIISKEAGKVVVKLPKTEKPQAKAAEVKQAAASAKPVQPAKALPAAQPQQKSVRAEQPSAKQQPKPAPKERAPKSASEAAKPAGE